MGLFAQDQLKKCVEEEFYIAAAAFKERITALMLVDPCSPRHIGRSRARCSALLAAGQGSQTATGPIGASAPGSDAVAKRVGEEEEGERRRAGLLRAREQFKKCVQDISALVGAEPCPYRVAESGSIDAGRSHSGMVAWQGELSFIDRLVGRVPSACSPVRLEGVTLLSIGKVSVQGMLPGKGQGKGKKGKRGQGRSEAGTQNVQPVYFGDDNGKVICILAIGELVNRIPSTVSKYAYVDISSLMLQAAEPGVLF